MIIPLERHASRSVCIIVHKGTLLSYKTAGISYQGN